MWRPARPPRWPAFSGAMCWSRSTAQQSNRRPTSLNFSIAARPARASRTRCCASARVRRSRCRWPRPRTVARCTSCWRRWDYSRCWSVRRFECGARAIRRRCISSGCASPSSASSRSRSTARSIASTGSSTGATPSRSPCSRRCCCTSRWSSPSAALWHSAPRHPAPAHPAP